MIIKNKSTNYIYSINTLRFIANFCIVLVHCKAFYILPTFGVNNVLFFLSYIFYDLSRLALPVFFMLAGYLFGKVYQRNGLLNSTYMKFAKKISFIFICLVFLYSIPVQQDAYYDFTIDHNGFLHAYYWHLLNLFRNPIFLIVQGPKYHLWFLPALLFGITFITLLITMKLEKLLIYIIIIPYLLCSFFKPFIDTPVIANLTIMHFIGLAMSITQVGLGYLMAKEPKLTKKMYQQLCWVGIVMLLIQSLFTSVFQIDINKIIMVGSVPLAMGVIIWAILHPNFGKNSIFSAFGTLTLWIYGIHPFILDQLIKYKYKFDFTIWNIFFPISVYAISLVIVFIFKWVFILIKNNIIKFKLQYPTNG